WYVPRDVSLLAPVQPPAGGLRVEVANISDTASIASVIGSAWPALFAVLLWGYGWLSDKAWFRIGGWALGWARLGWAALRWPNGGGVFVLLLIAFLVVHLLIPVLKRLWQMPRQPESATRPSAQGGAAPAVTGWLLVGLLAMSLGSGCAWQSRITSSSS